MRPVNETEPVGLVSNVHPVFVACGLWALETTVLLNGLQADRRLQRLWAEICESGLRPEQ